MRSDPGPSLEPVPDDPRADLVDVPLYATAEEVAYAEQLAALDRADDAAARAEWAAAGFEVDPIDPLWDDLLADLASDVELLARMSGPAHEADLMALASIDPRSLPSPHARVDYLQRCDRVAALVASRRAEAVVALAGETSTEAYLPEVAVEHEVATARRTSTYAAGKLIETSRALATTFPGFAAALRAGEVSEAHCSVLVERTRVVTDPAVLAEIERRTLGKATRLTPGQFGGEVAKAIALLDRDAAGRLRRARESRRVWVRQLEDGMGYFAMTHEWPVVEAMMAEVRADGRALQLAPRAPPPPTPRMPRVTRRDAAAGSASTDLDQGTVGGDDAAVRAPGDTDETSASSDDDEDDATADACRADAFAARVLGRRNEDGSLTWDRSEVDVVVNLVIDLDTLRGEADRIALLDGQPVPGEIGREVARFGSWWRRLVTDPVDGHLIDFGRAQYLPEKLRRFVFARDGGCRTPYCGVHAESRLQLDHAEEWPVGESSAANTGAHCTTCHQLKTAGYADITDSNADGSYTWRTGWGQTIHVPPRPVLDDPDPPPAEPAPPLDPPPF